jgi:hypothetical protein
MMGMTIEIGDVAYPQSGLAELSQVELRDVETGEPLARAAAIEVTSTTGGYSLEVIAPEIDAAKLGRLAQILHERLLCQGIVGTRRCEFFASELTLNDKTASRTLVDLQAEINTAETGPRPLHWPEAVDPEHTVQWSLTHNLTCPSRHPCSVNTGQASIPCHLAKVFWPPLNGWDRRRSSAAKCPACLSGVVRPSCGTFSRVDLDACQRAVSADSQRQGNGQNRAASIDNGRLIPRREPWR